MFSFFGRSRGALTPCSLQAQVSATEDVSPTLYSISRCSGVPALITTSAAGFRVTYERDRTTIDPLQADADRRRPVQLSSSISQSSRGRATYSGSADSSGWNSPPSLKLGDDGVAPEGGRDVAPDIINRTVGLPWAQSRALLLSHFGESFPVDQFQEAWVRHFWVMTETRLEIRPGAFELLDALDELRIPRAIATSSFRRTVERHLTAYNLMGRFDEIVRHGDYQEGKPAPDPFLKAAERLGVEPLLCLALEDSHIGVRSASAAGMMTVRSAPVGVRR
jgi:HAD superfamily hydrolase (TIGR01509 family)